MKQNFIYTEFFRRKEVATMTVKELFDFITDPLTAEEELETRLDKISEKLANQAPLTDEQVIADEVFKNAFIPQRMTQVKYINFIKLINVAFQFLMYFLFTQLR